MTLGCYCVPLKGIISLMNIINVPTLLGEPAAIIICKTGRPLIVQVTEAANAVVGNYQFLGVQHIFLNIPQNISLKSNSYTDHCGTTAF